jgi:hypothetical protein
MLISFPRANRDIFAWKPADMPGVPKKLIEHCLKVDPKATSKKQRLRYFAPNKREAINKEQNYSWLASLKKSTTPSG